MITLLLTYNVLAENITAISPITTALKQRMIQGNSWKKGCPVPLENLRYLQLKYLNFQGKTSLGEMIVHKSVAKEVVHIFNELYAIGYPIHTMKLVSAYKGDDWQSIEADNTSAFNCRRATGSKNWSKHSYGKAIDLNSIENPYISRTGHIAHKASHIENVHIKNIPTPIKPYCLKTIKQQKYLKNMVGNGVVIGLW